jgi:tRNA U34 5-carboxymethylaminomethyl modifying GTPase MnmE/TrmE
VDSQIPSLETVPVVIVGPPGVGKSCFVFMMLARVWSIVRCWSFGVSKAVPEDELLHS